MIINGSPRKKDINGIDMLHVDDESLADAHEDASILANLLGQGLLHLAEVHADGGAALVDRHDMGEVAVGLTGSLVRLDWEFSPSKLVCAYRQKILRLQAKTLAPIGKSSCGCRQNHRSVPDGLLQCSGGCTIGGISMPARARGL